MCGGVDVREGADYIDRSSWAAGCKAAAAGASG